ncbi:MAG: hypothetical protein C4330_08090 [Chitinophagaceae bacterium]
MKSTILCLALAILCVSCSKADRVISEAVGKGNNASLSGFTHTPLNKAVIIAMEIPIRPSTFPEVCGKV